MCVCKRYSRRTDAFPDASIHCSYLDSIYLKGGSFTTMATPEIMLKSKRVSLLPSSFNPKA
nr:unnamed protein product [Callosobruchus chinensis]